MYSVQKDLNNNQPQLSFGVAGSNIPKVDFKNIENIVSEVKKENDLKDFVKDNDWLNSEESRNLMLLIEEDIYKKANFLQRNTSFDIDKKKMGELMVGGVGVMLLLVYAFFITLFTSGFAFGFFITVGSFFFMVLSCIMISGAHPVMDYLLMKNVMKDAMKRFENEENFMSFIIALSLIEDASFLKNGKVNEDKVGELKSYLKKIYPAVSDFYDNERWGNVDAKINLSQVFFKIMNRVGDINKGSWRDKKLDKLIFSGEQEKKDAVFEYFKK